MTKRRKPKVWFVVLGGGKRTLDPKHAPWRPKLLEPLNGQTVISYVIDAASGVTAARVVGVTAIISTRYEEVLRQELKKFPDIQIAVQDNHRGTADAVWQAIKQGVFPQADEADFVVVLMGDQPLVTSHDLDEFIISFLEHQPMRAGILTFNENRRKPEYRKCGVVIRQKRRFYDLQARIEYSRRRQKEELHAGPYIYQASWFRGFLYGLGYLLEKFPLHMPEIHLYTALLAAREDTAVHTYCSHHPKDFLGVDTVEALEEVRRRMARRHRNRKVR